MRLDAKRLADSATEFLFDRERAIYIRRRHFKSVKCWSVRNEYGEFLNKSLEFEPAAGQVKVPAFVDRTEFTLENAFQLASAYIGKAIRDKQEELELLSKIVRERGPGTIPIDSYTPDVEDETIL